MSELPHQEITALLRSGRMLDAWEIARETGIPLEKWPQGKERRVAAMLASSLGANRLSEALNWLNWRADPKDPEFFLHALFSRMRFTPEIKLLPEIENFLAKSPAISPEKRADLLAFQSYLLAAFRDFGPAFDCIGEALELAPDKSWIHVEHAVLLEMADRYEDALEAAEKAIKLRPYYRAAVLQKADILVHLGRDEEAIELLEEADSKTQNAAFAGRLQSFHSERENHEESLKYLERFEERSPLADEKLRKWIAGRRADFLYMAGDIDGFIEWADKAGKGFHRTVSQNLRKEGARSKKRVRLPVPFVRQHNMTCAPATLAALSSFLGKKHDHLEIADAICHDGTPWHKERKWAEENGFTAREFRVTDESSRELLDRGIPFTLTTQAATSAHLQACIGYDERAGILLLRDPTHRHFGEVILSGLIDGHPFAGPRGMVMVPNEDSHKIADLHLPDESAYDAYHELLVALDSNDRLRIESARTLLRTVAPGHPLILEGEERVAIWKGDWVAQFDAINASLEIAPNHQSTLLQKMGALRRLGRWQELRTFLREQASNRNSDPVFAAELGELLMEDARHLEEAERYLWKAMRDSRREARIFESMGRCLSIQKKHSESARFRRVSASLAGSFEPYSRGYFDACRALRQAETGLDFLRERVARMGKKSAGPWLTLAESLNALDRHDEAAKVLSEAALARPDDGELKLSAGELMAGWGGTHRDTGLEWIDSSRGSVPELRWLTSKARTASFLGDSATAIRCWRTALQEQPQYTAAWRGLVRNIAEQDGEDEAIRMLDEATDRYPDDVSLWILKAEWLADTKRGPLEALDRALELDPEDNWAIRERAIRRLHADDKEGAESDARHAVALNPWSPHAFWTLGCVLAERGETEEAKSNLREAIRHSVDFTSSSWRLLNLARDREEKLEVIGFIESEMRRQVSNGEILLAYQSMAWNLIEPPELLDRLQAFSTERPDLWQTWAARVEQSLDMRFDEGARLAAEELTSRFPLLPRAWLDLGRVHKAAGRHEEEEKAVARACEISPGWDKAARSHATVLERLGRLEEAISVLRRACRLDPLNGPNYGELADSLRRAGHRDEAYDALSQAMRLAPFYAWAWTASCEWSVNDGLEEMMPDRLREGEKLHGHHKRWHGIAADCWDILGNGEEALASSRRGLERSPKDATLRDNVAYQLAAQKKFDEALAACEPVEGETVAPTNLRGRRAWILMRSGQPLKGVAEMKALLEAEPDYAWGFNELADWHYYRNEWKELREICIRWLRASPADAKVLGFLGGAELNLENHKEAKSAFARAFAADPEYTYAARNLMDLQMRDGEFEEAEHTLERLRHYSSSIHVDCDAIELFLKKKEVTEALSIMDSILKESGADENLFEHVERLFKGNNASSAWENWLKEIVKTGPHAAPGYLVAYLRTLPTVKLSGASRKWIKREEAGSDARDAAWTFIIQTLVEKRDADGLTALKKKNRQEFRASGRLWRTMGQALLELDLTKAGVEWFSDWRERSDELNSSAYLNIAALYDSSPGDGKKLWKIAGEIRAEGFKRYPDTNYTHSLRAGHSLHLALQGKIAEAEELLENYDASQVTDYYSAMGNAAFAVIAADQGNAEDARKHLREAISFFGRYSDLGSIRTRQFTEQSVANGIPEFKGKVSRLKKSWYPELPQNGKGQKLLSSIGLEGMPWWVIGIIVIVILKIFKAALAS